MYETCVITVHRQSGVCYIDPLIESFGPFPLKFIAGNQSVTNGYLDKYRENPLIKIIEQDYLYMPKHVNLNLNFFRAMLHQQHSTEFMILEDDVIFSANWFLQLQRTREEIPHKSYLLSLYRPGFIESTDPFIEIRHNDFSCSQALLFINLPVVEMMTYVYKYGVDKFTDAADLLIPRFLKDKGIPILAINPSIVQHMGMVGNNISAHFHQSGTFNALHEK